MPPPMMLIAEHPDQGHEERDEVGRRVADDELAELRARRGDVGGRVVERRPGEDRVDELVRAACACRAFAAVRFALARVDLLEDSSRDRRRDVGGVGAQRDQLATRSSDGPPRDAEDAVGELPGEVLGVAGEPLGEGGGEELGRATRR